MSGGGPGPVVTNKVAVTPAAPSQLVITSQPPASVTAGSGFGLDAAIEDVYGNVVTTATNAVTVALASNPGGSSLGGTTSATPTLGVAYFSGLTLTKAASGYTLQASSSGLTAATSGAVNVTPAAAAKVAITEQPPATVAVNGSFGLTATIEDAYGNVVTSASNTVKVALSNNPTGAKLGGTLSEKASNGMATFSGLTINKVGSGYTLQLTSSGLSSAVTNAFNVTKTGTSSVAIAPGRDQRPRFVAGPAGARQSGSLGWPGAQEARSLDLILTVVRGLSSVLRATDRSQPAGEIGPEQIETLSLRAPAQGSCDRQRESRRPDPFQEGLKESGDRHLEDSEPVPSFVRVCYPHSPSSTASRPPMS